MTDKNDNEKLDALRQAIGRGFDGSLNDFDISRIKRLVRYLQDADTLEEALDDIDLRTLQALREIKQGLAKPIDDLLEMIEEDEKVGKDLLRTITPDNVHPETDWGKPVGKECGTDDSDIS